MFRYRRTRGRNRDDVDLEILMLDCTIARVHQHAAGSIKRKAASARPLARGDEYEIHAAVDALGNIVCWIMTSGDAADLNSAALLIEGLKAQAVIADIAYDADEKI